MSVPVAVEADIVQVMEQMPYGMYIVGSSDINGVPNGMMADWVMQVSFHPRLVAVSFENDAHTLANIRSNGWFTVNLLPEDEAGRKLAAQFAQPYEDAKVLGRMRHTAHPVHTKLDGLDYSTAAGGGPILAGALSWLECQAEDFMPIGDHTLVTGYVRKGGVLREAEPLTSNYTGWTYSG